jgi:hypothetical protein
MDPHAQKVFRRAWSRAGEVGRRHALPKEHADRRKDKDGLLCHSGPES